MAAKTDIWVYAHWKGLDKPKCIGVLTAQQAKGRKAFSFSYSDDCIISEEQQLLDPDITWYKGQQYPDGEREFRHIFRFYAGHLGTDPYEAASGYDCPGAR